MQIKVTGTKKLITKAELYSCPTGFQLRLETSLAWPRFQCRKKADSLQVDILNDQGEWSCAEIQAETPEDCQFIEAMVPFFRQKSHTVKVHLFLGKQRGKLVAEAKR